MQILLTFTGLHDPYSDAPVAGSVQDGPVLTLLRYRSFEKVVLVSTPRTIDRTADTAAEIGRRHASIEVLTHQLEIDNPIEYAPILAGLRRLFREVSDSSPGGHYFVATASGTPQMHASWLLLVASAEIPGTILYVRQPQFVYEAADPVMEIDPTQAHFPAIRFRIASDMEHQETAPPDTEKVAERLGIVGKHPAFRRALATAAVLAESRFPVLISGETGTGKEKVARLIHDLSDRRSGPYVPVNCAAIPKELAESYLFGHRKGAFTGATETSGGRFQLAHHGTLFLDEISEMPLEVQAKILRAVQEGIIEPLGSPAKAVDFRLVAATNRDLESSVKEGRFREDLFYRLQVGDVRIPSLRERRSDISLLATFFLDEINLGLRPQRRFVPDSLQAICAYDWPGNVRQLRNSVQRGAMLARGGEITVENLSIPSGSPQDSSSAVPQLEVGFSVESYLKSVRQSLFERAIDLSGGNQSEAARLLGVTPQAVSKFLKGGSG